MSGKLSTVVKGDGLSHRLWHGYESFRQDALNSIGLLVRVPVQESHTRRAFVHDQQVMLAIRSHHQISFPMTALFACLNTFRSLVNIHSVWDQGYRASTTAASVAALGLGSWQIQSPFIVLGTFDLGINKAIAY